MATPAGSTASAARRSMKLITLDRVAALASLMVAAGASAASPTPLLDYALSQSFDIPTRDFVYGQHVTSLQYELEHNPPPATDCASTLGAKRFAAMYGDLGSARSNLADYEGAVEAFEKALSCTPRAAHLYGELASELIHLSRYVEARAIAEQGLVVDEGDDSFDRILGQLDYIEERWADAIEHLRKAVATTDDDAVYWQCLLWLAQRRAGTQRPQLAIVREGAEHWPQLILDALTDGGTEAELVKNIEDEHEAARRREILAEALFYMGERRLADAEIDAARRYLAATVDLKVHYFVEHHLALAELAKLNARMNFTALPNAPQQPP